MAGEFELITRYFAGWGQHSNAVLLGVGDDCAQLSVPPGFELSVSIDTMVEGVHFFPGTSPDVLGYRALSVAVSDLAAMGASPLAFTSALTLPAGDSEWLASFAAGLRCAAEAFQIPLVGGDTTRGPLSVTIQVMGLVPSGLALRRSGASVGDLVCLSGPLGDAGLGLHLAQNYPLLLLTLEKLKELGNKALSAYLIPEPKLVLGKSLSGVASACIDVSDGLLGDLGHITERSKVGARILKESLPVSSAVMDYCGAHWLDFVLTAGDDYELCFTVHPDTWRRLTSEGNDVLAGCSVIGEIVDGSGVVVVDGNDNEVVIERHAFQHF